MQIGYSSTRERERERNCTTSIQPAWLMRTDLCSCLGHLQNGCEAMANSLLVLVPHEQTHGAFSILNQTGMSKQACDADCRLPATKSWRSCYEDQLHNHLVSSPTEDTPNRRRFSLPSAQFQHIQQLGQQTSSKGKTYSHIEKDYASDTYNHIHPAVQQ